MYVEDALVKLANAMVFKRKLLGELAASEGFARRFITDVRDRIEQDKALSSRQAEVFLRLLDQHRNEIISSKILTDNDISTLINAPIYRRPPYQSFKVKRQARYLGDNLVGFKFKFDPELSQFMRDNLFPIKIPQSKHYYFSYEGIYWNPVAQLTIVPITKLNFQRVINFISEKDFEPDMALADYLAQCSEAGMETSKAVIEDGRIRLTVNNNTMLAAWVKNAVQGTVR